MSIACDILSMAIQDQKPLVLLLGQHAWADANGTDIVLDIALTRLNKGSDARSDWLSLLDGTALTTNAFEWLGERFQRRVHPTSLEILTDIPWSAVFTSSLDPTLSRLFSRGGRDPDPVLINDYFPRVVRSRARPPLYYLFSQAGVHDPKTLPPVNRTELNAHRFRHTVQLLNRLHETVTAIGYIAVEGFKPGSDWLRVDDLLGAISGMGEGQVLWFGGMPELQGDGLVDFKSAIERGQIIVEDASLASVISELRALERLPDILPLESEDIGVITFGQQNQLAASPELRLKIEAVASIVDDSWTAFLPPLGTESEYSIFRRFHGQLEGPPLLVEGVRRGFAIERDFETSLLKSVRGAVANHSSIDGPIIVKGQSGTGKSVALARVVWKVRQDKSAAVLYSIGRIPQAEEVSSFCEAAEEAGAKSTLIVCDANRDVDHYYDLLMGLRSRGRRAVVLGSHYLVHDNAESRWNMSIEAPVNLSKGEREKLTTLLTRHSEILDPRLLEGEHFLGFLYRFLPPSRSKISLGLGNEAFANEQTLRELGRQAIPVEPITAVHQALIDAGVLESHQPVFEQGQNDTLTNFGDTATRIIDLVMVAGTLDCPVPFNLLLRAATEHSSSLDGASLGKLFGKLGLFKWQHVDNEGNELLVAPRLTLEAKLICRRRLGTEAAEANHLLELIGAVRSGIERREELDFLLKLLQQINPDGQRNGRYREYLAVVAKKLTEIRQKHNVVDARLMLQESSFRRAAVRTEVVEDEGILPLLEEARNIVQDALNQLESGKLKAPKKTKQNLLVEHAALYGFLSIDKARRKMAAGEIWSSYEAAQRAVRRAVAATESYYPLDVGLWTPDDLLKEAALSPIHRKELIADIYATLDQVEKDSLRPSQRDKFDVRKYLIGKTLENEELTDAAYSELEARGSTAGYYLRAREYAPDLGKDSGDFRGREDRSKARQASEFLSERFRQIESDSRCLFLLLECRWISEMGRRPLRGERQPLPSKRDVIRDLLELVRALNSASGESSRHGTRYLEAVLTWLIGEYTQARMLFRQLADDTDFENPSRVIRRHIMTSSDSTPRRFEGLVVRQRGENDWELRIDGLHQLIHLRGRDFPDDDITEGRTIRGLGIGFNFIGPIAHPLR